MTEIKNLKITDVEIWNIYDANAKLGLSLSWECNIGWGKYSICYDGDWYIDDECMEDPDDREFGKLVLSTWLDSLKDNPQYKFGEYEE